MGWSTASGWPACLFVCFDCGIWNGYYSGCKVSCEGVSGLGDGRMSLVHVVCNDSRVGLNG